MCPNYYSGHIRRGLVYLTVNSTLFEHTECHLRLSDFAEEDHCRDYIGLEAGFLVEGDAVSIKHCGCDLSLFAADAGDVGGQAVEVKSFAVLCQ